MSTTTKENLFRKEWAALENEETQPRYLRGAITTSFEEFSAKVLEQDPIFVRSTVESIYAGDAYIVKRAFPAQFITDLRKTMHEYGKESPSSFHKMVDGCPDFHRKITPELAKNYTLRQIKHSYYFFPWNEDRFHLLESIYKRWGVFKFLGGFQFHEYTTNIPSDGVIDRLQIVNYLSGIGELEVHSDPYLYQKIAICGVMSKRGKDYFSGGAYALNEDRERVDLEDSLDVGDIYFLYPTVFHGVETIDKDKEADWNSISGRWFMGLYSNVSDAQERRHTCYGVEEVLSSGVIKIPHSS
jgi:hypothetical protein